MRNYTSRIKRQLRDLAGVVHEREVRLHLDKLYEQFAGWKAGSIDTFDLTVRIHEFHNGPDRKLFVRYSGSDVDWLVAAALERGVLCEAEVPAEVLEAISEQVANFRRLQDYDSANEDPAETSPEAGSPRLARE